MFIRLPGKGREIPMTKAMQRFEERCRIEARKYAKACKESGMTGQETLDKAIGATGFSGKISKSIGSGTYQYGGKVR